MEDKKKLYKYLAIASGGLVVLLTIYLIMRSGNKPTVEVDKSSSNASAPVTGKIIENRKKDDRSKDSETKEMTVDSEGSEYFDAEDYSIDSETKNDSNFTIPSTDIDSDDLENGQWEILTEIDLNDNDNTNQNAHSEDWAWLKEDHLQSKDFLEKRKTLDSFNNKPEGELLSNIIHLTAETLDNMNNKQEKEEYLMKIHRAANIYHKTMDDNMGNTKEESLNFKNQAAYCIKYLVNGASRVYWYFSPGKNASSNDFKCEDSSPPMSDSPKKFSTKRVKFKNKVQILN